MTDFRRMYSLPSDPEHGKAPVEVRVVRPEPPRGTLIVAEDSVEGRASRINLDSLPSRLSRALPLLEEGLSKYGTTDGRALLERALRELRS